MANFRISPPPGEKEKVEFDKPSISGSKLARNSAFNFAGQVLPLIFGIALIPYIIRGLGPDRFGMLGIIWVIFGYFTLMDLGLGRATTKFLAEWLAAGETDRISEMVWSSIIVQLILGMAGGLLIAALTPLLVEKVLKTPIVLVSEARATFYILAATLPAILATNGLRAVLEGCERFDITNLLRIPASVLAFAIPALGVAVGLHLPGIVLWMAISRVVFALAHCLYCARVLPCLKARPSFRSKTIYPLLSFGGWVTISNAVNPLLMWMDRFLIGSLLSMAMVGYYTAPFEAVTKLWIIPVSLMSTVYPACSALGKERKNELQILYWRLVKYLFCALAPVSVILVLFAHTIIRLWLGPGFVDKSVAPLQLLAVGVFINCFVHVPYSFLQALGRPDPAAKLFLFELVPYAFLMWWMIERHGIVGAAAAWSIRVAIEVLVLMWITQRLFSLSAINLADRRMWMGIAALLAMAVATYATNLLFRNSILIDIGLCAVWMGGFVFIVWKWVLDGMDRASALAVISPAQRLLGKSFGIAEAD